MRCDDHSHMLIQMGSSLPASPDPRTCRHNPLPSAEGSRAEEADLLPAPEAPALPSLLLVCRRKGRAIGVCVHEDTPCKHILAHSHLQMHHQFSTLVSLVVSCLQEDRKFIPEDKGGIGFPWFNGIRGGARGGKTC